MPIEIRELVIKATLEDQASAKGSGGNNRSAPNNTNSQQMLVNICVEKVLEILREKRER